MPLLYQKHILRKHLQANRGVIFVFGDNVQRLGFKGQAAEMRGEFNAHGIATKWAPSFKEDAFFKDSQINEILPILEKDISPLYNALMSGQVVVWPADGIGTGLSRLPAKAPNIWAVLEAARIKLEAIQ